MSMHCPACNADNASDARRCVSCQGRLPRRSRRRNNELNDLPFDPDSDPRLARALRSWRLAVYAMIPLAGLVLGPAAFVLGLLSYRRGEPELASSGNGHALAAMLIGGLAGLTNWIGLVLMIVGLKAG
jgi:hypothetical protein